MANHEGANCPLAVADHRVSASEMQIDDTSTTTPIRHICISSKPAVAALFTLT